MKFLEMIGQESEFVTALTKKLSPPLVTLLSSEPEVQYVSLRNINLIVQKRLVVLFLNLRFSFGIHHTVRCNSDGSYYVMSGVS